MAEVMEATELNPIAHGYIGGIRALQILEPDLAITDIDSAPPFEPEPFTDHDHAIDVFEGLKDRAPNELPENELPIALGKLVATITLLKSLRGDHFEFDDLLRNTIGHSAEEVTEEELARDAGEIDDKLSEVWDLGFDAKHRKAYYERFGVATEADLKALAEATAPWASEAMAEYGITPPGVPVELKMESKNTPILGWFGIEDGNAYQLYNTNPAYEPTAGLFRYTGVHEEGHGPHYLSTIIPGIRNGRVSQLLAISTLYSPEAIWEEGLADMMAQIIMREKGSPEDVLAAMMIVHRYKVQNNVSRMVNGADGREYSEAEALEFAMDHLRFQSRVSLENSTASRKNDPIYQIYLASYLPGLNILGDVWGLPMRAKIPAIQELTSKVWMPDQMREIVARHMAEAA